MTEVMFQESTDAVGRSVPGADDVRSGSEPGGQAASSVREFLPGVGAALRVHRLAKGLSLRQFARQLGVSASFISQLENGKSRPSVTTLFAICEALDVTVDQLFAESGARSDKQMQVDSAPASARSPRGSVGRRGQTDDADRRGSSSQGPVVHSSERPRLVLDTGVAWEKLSSRDAPGQFLMITYEVGGSSTAGDQLTRRSGTEYGLVIRGQLTLSLGFETYILTPTDSISFDSSIPHRLHNDGYEPAEVVWFVQNNEALPLQRTAQTPAGWSRPLTHS